MIGEEYRFMNSQKALHNWPSRASYGVTFVSILERNICVVKRFDCLYKRYKYIVKNKATIPGYQHTSALIQALPVQGWF